MIPEKRKFENILKSIKWAKEFDYFEAKEAVKYYGYQTLHKHFGIGTIACPKNIPPKRKSGWYKGITKEDRPDVFILFKERKQQEGEKNGKKD